MAEDLGSVAEFEHGAFRTLEVGGRDVGVLLWEDDVYVVRNICPHAFAPVCAGVVTRKLVSGAVGELGLEEHTATLLCPWHRWEFTLPEGRATRNPKYRLKTYKAWIDNGRVFAEFRASTGTEG
jgi:nitrite reductase/ring-hydroxylating ferredoxin subunit